ncbi:MAG: hypothetical protein IJ506_03840 [Clostridia bacterium]|nr:hypothetical protein [Clostridia bacterium]
MRKLLLSLFAFSAVCCALFGIKTGNGATQAQAEETASLDPTYYALVLNEYSVPNYEEGVRITDPQGKEVEVRYGVFRPLSVGEYTIEYADRTQTLTVLLHSYPMSFDVEDTFQDSYKAGQFVYIGAAAATDAFTSYTEYDVNVYCNNERIGGFQNVVKEEKKFSLPTAGEYRVEYAFEDVLGGTQTQSYTFSASNEPVIVYDRVDAYVRYETQVNLGVSYGYYEKEFYDVSVSVVKPDGVKETVTDVYYLPETLGEYTIVYESNVNGAALREEQKFEVYYTPANYLNVSDKAEVAVGQKLPDYVARSEETPETGASVSVLAADTFYYKPIVDLRTLTKDDTLISFYPSTTCKNVTNIYVYLTDIYDPTNVISIRFWKNPWTADNCYLMVKRAQNSYGVSNEAATKGQIRKLYGTVAYYCSLRPDQFGSDLFNLQYDGATDTLYSTIRGTQYEVLELCSEELDFVDRFYGFTTGEVYVSVKIGGYGGIYLQEIANTDMTTIGVEEYDLGENYIVFDEYYETRPMPVKGYSYTVPTVHASPVCGETLNIIYSVYDENGNAVETKNGAFTPTTGGEYKIVYSSPLKDLKIEKTLTLTVKEAPTEIQIELPQNQSARSGEYYAIPKISAVGGEGEYTYAYKLYNEDGEYIADDFGRYLITTGKTVIAEITVCDYVGYKKTFSYQVEVDNDVSVLTLQEALPRAVRAGEQLTLPAFEVVDYRTGKALEKQLVINGEVVALTTETYTLTVPEVETLTIRFAGGLGTEAETEEDAYTYTIEVLPKESSQSDLIKYDEEKTDVIYLENGMTFVSKTEGDTRVSYPYAVPANGIELKFAVGGEQFEQSAVILSFTDERDASKNLSFKISGVDVKRSTATIEQIGVGEKYAISCIQGVYTENCGSAERIEKIYYVFDVLFYSQDGSIRTTSDAEIIRAKTYTNGLSYAGFSDNLSYLDIAMESAAVGFEVSVDTIGNQKFNYALFTNTTLRDGDNAGPMLKTDEPLVSSTEAYGSTYKVPMATAHDVLQGSGTVRVTVLTPSGNKVINNVAMGEDISFALTEYGYYKVQYVATDAIGQKSTKEIKVLVKDETLPVFNLSGSYKTSYTVGKTITLLAGTVSNRTDAEIRILVKRPDMQYVFLQAEENFSLDMLGEYEIVYLIYDSSNAITRTAYKFEVKAK